MKSEGILFLLSLKVCKRALLLAKLMSIQKICVKDLISGASLLALLPKDLSWMVSEKSGDFFYPGEWQPC